MFVYLARIVLLYGSTLLRPYRGTDASLRLVLFNSLLSGDLSLALVILVLRNWLTPADFGSFLAPPKGYAGFFELLFLKLLADLFDLERSV